MSLKGKTVLVTGAGGFIGSHLAEACVREGANVRAMVHYNALGSRGWLDRSPIQAELDIRSGDITDPDSAYASVEGCDIVFHLAALIAIPYSYQAPHSYVRTNIEGTLNVLNAVRRFNVGRMLHTSTSEVYGTAQTVPISEEHPLQGQSPYSASKIGADKIVESYFCSFETPVTIIRPFNTFGPRQSARAVIPTIISQCLAGKEVVKLGTLNPTRDLNYVGNTVEGYLAAATAPDDSVGETYNLGSGREISIGDLADLIISLSGCSAVIECEAQRLRPDSSEVERLLADADKARDVLGWEPEYTLEEGLEKTIAWIGDNLANYRPDEYTV